MIEGELPTQPVQPSIANQDNNNKLAEGKAEEQKEPAVANGRASRKGKDTTEVVTPTQLEDKFSYICKLGEGTYGVVYKATELATDEIVAIKEIKIDHCDDGIPSTAIREIAVLQELRENDYIVKLKEIIHSLEKNRLFLVFEYFNTDMKKYLDKKGSPMDANQVRNILY